LLCCVKKLFPCTRNLVQYKIVNRDQSLVAVKSVVNNTKKPKIQRQNRAHDQQRERHWICRADQFLSTAKFGCQCNLQPDLVALESVAKNTKKTEIQRQNRADVTNSAMVTGFTAPTSF